jgi:hypothetical protein
VKLTAEVDEFVPSDTTTASEPTATAGIVNVTVELPLALVVPPAEIAAATPPTVTVNRCEAANPDAVIDADVPTVPLVGLSPDTVA